MTEKQPEKHKKVGDKQSADSKKDVQESLLNGGFISKEEFNKEREQWKKKLAYALAEQENLKKSAQKEIEKVRDFAILDLVKEILVSVESLEKAVAHMLEHNVEGPVFEGSKLTLDAIFSALKKSGIEKIEAKGARFDHDLHQAVSTVKAADLPNNTVFEVLQDGYTIKGRLLRPAVVVVVDNFE
ncbi:nucleotide exchange factor GrpE [Neorickettsia sp. 179522]|uniref:nucleotide exchange factor GrpE n=1 Tax=Neorickettsia sp. 179522 TaxID=1714371 RepID=UPI0006051FED|nr:nucleotide exchange factor GrpE [Neorickettsia sp. 179522]KYH12344.1 molecular chaperone GrpE [Neorickettsia sp. 179522]